MLIKKVVKTRLWSTVDRDRKLNEKFVKKHRELFDEMRKKEEKRVLENKIARYMEMERKEEIQRACIDMGVCNE